MEASSHSVNRAELRVGAVALIVGGIGGFVANLFHPTPPSQTEALLRLVADAAHWRQLHFGIMLAVIFSVSGAAMLPANLADPMARAIGVLGRYMFLLSGAAFTVMIMIDGFASKFLADRWLHADESQKAGFFASGDAVVQIDRALFPVFAGILFGLSVVVMGLAVYKSGNFPRWLGAWGMAGGGLCLITGFGVALFLWFPLPAWLAGVVLVASWFIATGVVMWRVSSRAA